MNFLAHLWLADRTSTSLAGAVLGDVVRGSDLSAYPPDIAEGIRLHRRVDAATDRHPLMREARQLWPDGERRYAGILLDLASDFALSHDWPAFAAEPLSMFQQRAAEAMAAAASWFLLAGGRATTAPAFATLLASYATEAGIDEAIRRTATRLKQPAPMLQAGTRWRLAVPVLRAGLPGLLDDLTAVAGHSRAH